MKRLCIATIYWLSFSINMGTSSAAACTPIPTYSPLVEVLELGDFNDAGSEFDRAYQQRIFEDKETPTVFGVHRVEIVGTVNPVVLAGEAGSRSVNTIEISRGSVAVVTDFWGEPPERLDPYPAGFPEKWERIPDGGGCQPLAYPPDDDVGTVRYVMTTSDGTLRVVADDNEMSNKILDAGFGNRVSPKRDSEAEQRLLSEMQAEHDRILATSNPGLQSSRALLRSRWFTQGAVPVFVAAAVLFFLLRRRRRA